MESMIIYQKRLVLNLFIKKISQDQGLYIILGPRQFEQKKARKEYKEMNIRNEKSTCKEHFQNNGQARNVDNNIFDPRQFFDPCQNFMKPHHPRNPC